MNSSFSRIQIWRESLPLKCELKKPLWPNPQASIGEQLPDLKGLQCWRVVGPAFKIMTKLSEQIQDLLYGHEELLQYCEPKPSMLSFHSCMTGPCVEFAQPTIIFCSRSKRQRASAQDLFKKSKILDDYPGIKTETSHTIPVETSAEQAFDEVYSDASLQAILTKDGPWQPCGAPIAFEHGRLATLGGVLVIDGDYYGMTAQHARRECSDSEDSSDSDSDTEVDEFVNMTSRGSISDCSEAGINTDWSESGPGDSLSDDVHEPPLQIEDQSMLSSLEPIQRPWSLANRQISRLPINCVQNDLDYEVFPLDEPHSQHPNSMNLPACGKASLNLIEPSGVMRDLVETEIWAVTGTTGSVKGTLIQAPSYIKMPYSRTFQEMWAVKLDRSTMQGDCGSWVVEASTGKICGHIVAGCPQTGIAYIVPAYKVFDDIEQRFGSRPVLPMTKDLGISASLEPALKSQQLAPLLFTTGDVFSIIIIWLRWISQNPYLALEDRRHLILLALSSEMFRKCLQTLSFRMASPTRVWFSLAAQCPSRRSGTLYDVVHDLCLPEDLYLDLSGLTLMSSSDCVGLVASTQKLGIIKGFYLPEINVARGSLHMVRYNLSVVNPFWTFKWIQRHTAFTLTMRDSLKNLGLLRNCHADQISSPLVTPRSREEFHQRQTKFNELECKTYANFWISASAQARRSLYLVTQCGGTLIAKPWRPYRGTYNWEAKDETPSLVCREDPDDDVDIAVD
ncbi:Protein png1 [Lecanora helva]